jgi:hypothetical protein
MGEVSIWIISDGEENLWDIWRLEDGFECLAVGATCGEGFGAKGVDVEEVSGACRMDV